MGKKRKGSQKTTKKKLNGKSQSINPKKDNSALRVEREKEYAALESRFSASQRTGTIHYRKPKVITMKPATFNFGSAPPPKHDLVSKKTVIDEMIQEVETEYIPLDDNVINRHKRTEKPGHSNMFQAFDTNDDRVLTFSTPSFTLPASFTNDNLSKETTTTSRHGDFHAKFGVKSQQTPFAKTPSVSEPRSTTNQAPNYDSDESL